MSKLSRLGILLPVGSVFALLLQPAFGGMNAFKSWSDKQVVLCLMLWQE
ncbi:hypothetical protein AAC43_004117 [Salmonella enterica subsp. diarizonae]|nr:hypothetical protein [Salmonella enterica subsp. diarizonae]EDW1774072.1 hypothetical protein [Salmonella enterica subsp. diarizonae]EDW1845916.1 hypothetical protein [Salmonella enterica subsp. enterica]EDW9662079.1 hypothetical protein [Salmonella enterica subsp. enterica serovar Newport]